MRVMPALAEHFPLQTRVSTSPYSVVIVLRTEHHYVSSPPNPITSYSRGFSYTEV
jgi:hypothetical protein